MTLFDRNHPIRYAHDPDRYPNCLNDLDFIEAFNPENERGLTPLADRWLNVLWLFESEIRALHRQLKVDRDAALADPDQSERHPTQTRSPACPNCGRA